MTDDNLSVLITGASRGLGRALAEELAGKGARVVLVARGRDEVERAAHEIRASGGEAHALAYDVADKEAAHKIAGAAAALVPAMTGVPSRGWTSSSHACTSAASAASTTASSMRDALPSKEARASVWPVSSGRTVAPPVR